MDFLKTGTAEEFMIHHTAQKFRDFYIPLQDYFSRDGAYELFEYLSNYSLGMEINPIEIRCTYTEYTPEELLKYYSWTLKTKECPMCGWRKPQSILTKYAEEWAKHSYLKAILDRLYQMTPLLLVPNGNFIIKNF